LGVFTDQVFFGKASHTLECGIREKNRQPALIVCISGGDNGHWHRVKERHLFGT
jgi:hypothetical protein